MMAPSLFWEAWFGWLRLLSLRLAGAEPLNALFVVSRETFEVGLMSYGTICLSAVAPS